MLAARSSMNRQPVDMISKTKSLRSKCKTGAMSSSKIRENSTKDKKNLWMAMSLLFMGFSIFTMENNKPGELNIQ